MKYQNKIWLGKEFVKRRIKKVSKKNGNVNVQFTNKAPLGNQMEIFPRGRGKSN